MSTRRKGKEADEAISPRQSFCLFGHERALAHAANAIRGGRPPQAWLISGPPGVGKATLAYRLARYLLRFGAGADGPVDLSVPAADVVARQITAGAHPGLMVLERREDDKGKMQTVLKVDEIRRLGGFFGMTSGAGGWRVAIVDTADDMNDNAANALLKILEEPPGRSILILVAHAPGRLLPTIRSRTRRLDLRPLNDSAMASALAHLLPDMAPDERAKLATIAEGSPGLAVELAHGDGLALARDADALLSARGSPDIAGLFQLAERVARAADGLPRFGTLLAQGLERRIRERAELGQPGLFPWTEFWERTRADYGRADALHLEPRQTVLSSAFTLGKLQRKG